MLEIWFSLGGGLVQIPIRPRPPVLFGWTRNFSSLHFLGLLPKERPRSGRFSRAPLPIGPLPRAAILHSSPQHSDITVFTPYHILYMIMLWSRIILLSDNWLKLIMHHFPPIFLSIILLLLYFFDDYDNSHNIANEDTCQPLHRPTSVLPENLAFIFFFLVNAEYPTPVPCSNDIIFIIIIFFY